MEERKRGRARDHRPNCENGTCTRARQLYCKDHDKVLCSQCYTIMHIDCNCNEIKAKDEVQQYLDSVKSVIKATLERADELGAKEHVLCFNEEFSMYSELLAKIETKFKNISKSNRFYEYKPIIDEIICLQKSLTNSKSFIEYSKFFTLRSTIGELETSEIRSFASKYRMMSDSLSNMKDKLKTKMTEQNNAELKKLKENIKDKTKKRLTDKYKNTIEKLENKINELKANNSNLSSIIQVQKDENENEINLLKSSTIDGESILKESFNEERDRLALTFLNYTSFFKENEITLNLNEDDDNEFMADLESSRIRLPPMKAIILDCIYDEDKELKSFLKHCVPTVLEELAINDQNSNDQGINMSYYLDSFVQAVSGVYQQVFINGFLFTKEELQQVVVASAKAKTLKFVNCDFLNCKNLDFSGQPNYFTEVLVFSLLDRNLENSKSVWLEHRSLFKGIVKAISKSGLRNSLKSLLVSEYGVDETELEEMLGKCEITTISVGQEYFDNYQVKKQKSKKK